MKLIFRKNSDRLSELNDHELLTYYRLNGEMEVIGELFNRYGHLVLGVCLKYLKNEEEARDACMQIFEKLITELRKSEILQFKPWLHTVSRNHCLIRIRKMAGDQKFQSEVLKNFSEEFVNFWSEMNHIEEAEIELQNLQRALVLLDPDQRKCIELIYFHDRSYRQISEITGFDQHKVKSCIQNGKRNLKQILEQHHGKAKI